MAAISSKILLEQQFFSAVSHNDTDKINLLIQGKVDINAIPKGVSNFSVLQWAFWTNCLKIEAGKCLIQNGIHLEHQDNAGETILLQIADYYSQIADCDTNKTHLSMDKASVLGLFQALLEAGADVVSASGSRSGLGGRSVSEEAARRPELEAIVQEVSRKAAKEVFSALPGEWGITRIVCDYLIRDPGARKMARIASLRRIPTDPNRIHLLDWDSSSPSLLQMAASGAGQIAKLLRAQQINL